ncbi:P-loop containing nucleoside triphosphate hydrolase protein [Xylaria curta]|nr:P-loop containing nucleoside triphosphate hydrolase protein [Xylaria curta]
MEPDISGDLSGFNWTLPLPVQSNPFQLEGAGVVCETKRFDGFYDSSDNYIVLPAGQKYTDDDDDEDRGNESALTVTTQWNNAKEVTGTVLVIRSPHMKAAIKAVVPKYQSFDITIRHITIRGKPRFLFHYRQELLNYGALLLQHNANNDAARHIQHLISYMWDVFLVEIAAFTLSDIIGSEPELEHSYLWMEFRPGDVVYVQQPHENAFKFDDMSIKNTHWVLSGHRIMYDGEYFGFSSFETTINSYDGVKRLRDLDAVNFNRLSADKQQSVKERLVARGLKFIGYHGQKYLQYDPSLDGSSGKKSKTRIVADSKGYDSWGHNRGRVQLSSTEKKFSPEHAVLQMTETDLILCGDTIAGYSLKDNDWDQFHVDSIGDIIFDSQAFDNLLLSEDQKQQILSLVRVHEDDSFTFDDFIKGKGRGMVFLLYGEPGVGKTLTAESVAEYFQKPLLRLDAGTLGTTASSVERALKKTFALAERWNALLLLDEADVYLEQRKSKSLVHNGLVSVFLRMLEYYHGILFLTTNRISAFDRAFISRIHIAIRYPSLSWPFRRELWYSFLKQGSEETAEAMSREGVLDRLAAEPLNGRQIKNIVRTACALALSDHSTGGRISERHLQSSLRPIKDFMEYVEKEFKQSKVKDSGEDTGRSNINRGDEEASDEEEQDEEEIEVDAHSVVKWDGGDASDEGNMSDERDVSDEEDVSDEGDELDTDAGNGYRPNKRKRLE